MMDKLVFLPLMMILIISGCIQFVIQKEEFSKIYEVPEGIELNVFNRNGKIEIESWENNFVEVNAIKSTNHGSEEFQKVEIDVQVGNEVNIETKYLEKIAKVSVNYEIKIPKDMLVNKITTSNGRIVITSTKGNPTLKTSNGRIIVDKVDGFVSAKTSNGRIEIRNVLGVLAANTSNGKIIAEIPEIIEDELEIMTSNGSIELFIPSDMNANIEAKTSNGKIKLNEIEVVTSEMSSKYLNGRIGIGGKKLSLTTSNGSINFNKLVGKI